MSETERYWKARVARRYTQFTDLEKMAEQAVRELEATIERLKVCGNCDHHREGEVPYEGIWMDCAAWEKGDISVITQMPSSRCFFTPSRWTERGGE